jgi:hypothetical protein
MLDIYGALKARRHRQRDYCTTLARILNPRSPFFLLSPCWYGRNSKGHNYHYTFLGTPVNRNRVGDRNPIKKLGLIRSSPNSAAQGGNICDEEGHVQSSF